MSAPQDLLDDGWRVYPDPEIAGTHVFVHDVPGSDQVVVVAVAEEESDNYSVLMLPKDMEHVLATEVDGETVYPNDYLPCSFDDAIEYAGSFL